MANLAKSKLASVWPRRTLIPPSRPISGNICPGLLKSSGLEFEFANSFIVVALSKAEIPVVDVLWSTLTVNAVWCGSVFLSNIECRFNLFAISVETGAQIKPRACFAIKLTVSPVTSSARPTKSPSASLSSSSIRTINFPAFKSSIAFLTLLIIKFSSK